MVVLGNVEFSKTLLKAQKIIKLY